MCQIILINMLLIYLINNRLSGLELCCSLKDDYPIIVSNSTNFYNPSKYSPPEVIIYYFNLNIFNKLIFNKLFELYIFILLLLL